MNEDTQELIGSVLFYASLFGLYYLVIAIAHTPY